MNGPGAPLDRNVGLAKGQGSSKRRVALAIGNGGYVGGAALENPHNDASAVATALKRLGFEVRVDFNLTLERMKTRFDQFVNDIKGADVALFYYSGHGFQDDGINYLVPVSADLEVREAGQSLISLQTLIERMSEHTRTRLIFLDACRASPFKAPARDDTTKTRVFYVGEEAMLVEPPPGLAEIKPTTDTFIAFAAAPGGFAYDGDGDLSPFTAGVLKHIDATDLALSNFMIRVRNDVRRATGGMQETWDHSALTAPFFFNPGSLIWLAGNLIGLAALITSLGPYSFSLAAGESRFWVALGMLVSALTLIMFIAGLQRAYRNLRGEMDPDEDPVNRRTRSDMMRMMRKGLFGGFFGGIFAAPIVTANYYLLAAWEKEKSRPSFGRLLTEISIGSVLVGLCLGLCSLVIVEALVRGEQDKSWTSIVWKTIAGAILGGILAGLITGPTETLYFAWGDGRAYLAPEIMIPGALAGTAVIVFSIINYSLERINIRKLTTSAAVAGGFSLALGILAVQLLKLFPAENIEHTIGGNTPLLLLLGGIEYGILVGVVLGAEIGLTLAAVSSASNPPRPI